MNQDEDDRMVFDGIIANIAGGRRGEFNQRFGQPSNLMEASTGGVFPFADIDQTDPETGKTDGLLSRLAARTAPQAVPDQHLQRILVRACRADPHRRHWVQGHHAMW